MKLKKYNQFVKSINEDLDPDPMMETEPTIDQNDEFDNPEDLNNELGSNLGEDDFGDEEFDEFDDDDDDVVTPNSEFDDVNSNSVNDTDLDSDIDGLPPQEGEFPDEEEGHGYKGGLLMQELADRLGTEVNNNQIDYNGQTINYYSETEKFHIGKEKFDSVEEVLDFLNGGDSLDGTENFEVPETEIPEAIEDVVESRKYIKRFK